MTGPATAAGRPATPIRRSRPADTSGMARVSLQNHPLTASAALVWNVGAASESLNRLAKLEACLAYG